MIATLRSAFFGEGLANIRYQAFANCTSLESIAFPDALSSIGNEALADCTNLKTVSFGKDFASLVSNCFDGCTALENVNISEENASFRNVGGIVYNHRLSDIVYVPHAITGKVAIVEGYTKISTLPFQNRTKITEIYIPASVRTINSFAFNGCTLLTDIYYEGSEEDWNNITKDTNWSSGAEFTVHFNANIEE